MPGPPDDITPSELFLKLQESPRPSEVVNFPRKTADGKPIDTTRIQVLRGEDHDAARLLVKRKLCEKYKIKPEDLEGTLGAAVLNDGVARELLAMACLTEKRMANTTEEAPRYPRVFPDAESIGRLLTADETATLFQTYLLVQTKYGPFDKVCQTEEELSAWIVRLVEGAADYPLGRVSSAHWAELASSLAARAYLLSVVLTSLWSSLPDSLKSRLGACSLDTGLFGGPAESRPPGTMASYAISDVKITTEDAARMADEMKALEENAAAAIDEATQRIGD